MCRIVPASSQPLMRFQQIITSVRLWSKEIQCVSGSYRRAAEARGKTGSRSDLGFFGRQSRWQCTHSSFRASCGGGRWTEQRARGDRTRATHGLPLSALAQLPIFPLSSLPLLPPPSQGGPLLLYFEMGSHLMQFYPLNTNMVVPKRWVKSSWSLRPKDYSHIRPDNS
jgi:hypothetical protein